MILVDTSVWIGYFRGKPAVDRLAWLLHEDRVLLHPWVLGELALGHLGVKRSAVLADLREVPGAPVVPDEEVWAFIEERRIWATGLGWVDVHLLASALVADAGIWSLDRNLIRAAEELRIPLA